MVTTGQLAILLAIVTSLSPIYHFVHGRKERLLLSIIGVFGLIGMYGLESLNIFGMFLYAYAVMRFIPVTVAPHVFLALAMFHQTYGQVYRYLYEYLEYSLDWSLSGMLMTLRLAGAFWSLRDGKVQAENKDAHLSKLQKEAAINREISFLEFFGFAFYFPGVIVGPFGDIKQYLSFINYEGIYEALLPASDKKDCKRVTLKQLATHKGFFSRVLIIPIAVSFFYVFSKLFSEEALYTPEFRGRFILPIRLIYALLAVEVGNAKYYFTWSCGEIGTILSGLSFNGFLEDGSFDVEGNVQLQLLKFKTITDPKEISKYWSMSPQHFLRKDLFDRVKQTTGSYVFANLCTFLFSAFWHGVYPGYYLFFLHACVFSLIVSDLKHHIQVHFIEDEDGKPRNPTVSKIFNVICCISTTALLDYVIIPFRAMSLERSMIAWGSLWYMGHILSGVALIIDIGFIFLAPRKKDKKAKNSD